MDCNIYVVVFENDKSQMIGDHEYKDDKGPIVMETYVEDSSLEDAQRRVERFQGQYGTARIAKLVFIDQD